MEYPYSCQNDYIIGSQPEMHHEPALGQTSDLIIKKTRVDSQLNKIRPPIVQQPLYIVVLKPLLVAAQQQKLTWDEKSVIVSLNQDIYIYTTASKKQASNCSLSNAV